MIQKSSIAEIGLLIADLHNHTHTYPLLIDTHKDWAPLIRLQHDMMRSVRCATVHSSVASRCQLGGRGRGHCTVKTHVWNGGSVYWCLTCGGRIGGSLYSEVPWTGAERLLYSECVGVSVQWGPMHDHMGSWDLTLPSWIDRHDWKHYLRETLLAGGKNWVTIWGSLKSLRVTNTKVTTNFQCTVDHAHAVLVTQVNTSCTASGLCMGDLNSSSG